MMDFLLKYSGWSLALEYLKRRSPNPITMNEVGDVSYVYAGHGFNSQGGYLFKNNFEIAARYSDVYPDNEIQIYEGRTRQYSLGASKYIRGHRLKIQTDITFQDKIAIQEGPLDSQSWQVRFQIEAGI